MSGFEFVLVLYAIIIGLGISDILTGWGEQIRARHRMSAYPLQIVLSFLLLYFGISFLWSLWTYRNTDWTFSLYITMACIPLTISLASRIIRVDTSAEAPSAKDQYFRISRPVFLLLALIPAMIMLLSFTTNLGENVPDRLEPVEFMQLTVIRVAMCLLLLYAALSKKAGAHWAGVIVMILVVLLLSMRLTIRSIDGVS
jgi:hypothetical protein